MFTGDLTHTTDDPKERRAAPGASSRTSSQALKVKDVRFMPGEHDAVARPRQGIQGILRPDALHVRPQGRAFHRRSTTCPTRRRDRRRAVGVARGRPGQAAEGRRIVVFTHRPLFDLYPQWDWATRDGAKAIELLHAAPQRHRLLRPHPPGKSPHDRPHRAPRRQVADLPAAGAGLAAEAATPLPGTRRSPTGAWASAKSMRKGRRSSTTSPICRSLRSTDHALTSPNVAARSHDCRAGRAAAGPLALRSPRSRPRRSFRSRARNSPTRR